MQFPSSEFDNFARRHIGPDRSEIRQMLDFLELRSLDELVDRTVPANIRYHGDINLHAPKTEFAALEELRTIASKNRLFRSLIGLGYSDTITPGVIRRNILENPGWYTQYTPYQAEIAQGRLEALLNFQTMIMDLTSLEIANASLLDEATAAAEVMAMFFASKGKPSDGVFVIANDCHPQTIAVLRTRAKPLGIRILVEEYDRIRFTPQMFGALIQYPSTDGAVRDYRPWCDEARAAGVHVVVAADLLSLALLVPPGEFGADAAVGNTQRFGVPLGFGGPHAAYLATRDQFKRLVPGRIIGVSIDSQGQQALRMALQTREQHIRREKATSNICTAQVLLAVMASMYAVYHGPGGIRAIANRIHMLTATLAAGLSALGFRLIHKDVFDTVRIECDKDLRLYVEPALYSNKINVRWFEDCSCGISLDELSDESEVDTLLSIFSHNRSKRVSVDDLLAQAPAEYRGVARRSSPYLLHPVFNTHHSETEMLRYIRSLEGKDLSLTTSMIPLGSCTMKLNATSELLPISWPEFSAIHPFAPPEQTGGYLELFGQLEGMLSEITGFPAVSLQPNSGAQGEYAGLLVIRAYHESKGEYKRDICLIPTSAHGTNPASAVLAGMQVVLVRCDQNGNVDPSDLEEKARQFAARLGALMITYPSTHGVFEESIREICEIIHRHGGMVYMDGANMNAQVGLCRPADFGADVCHLNLHKTFCIPHGGGGPGMGPIAASESLAPFLPSHPLVATNGGRGIGPVSAAPWGSAGILPISWAYIAMMGSKGLTDATKVAILNANYMARKLSEYYPIVYRGKEGMVAHEFILDLRPVKASAGIEVEDVAKRLIDYGFHAPTTSFPVPGTLMIEPTESESLHELDRFCDAMISIRQEIREIETGEADRENNVLKNAPHTAWMIATDDWKFPYSRSMAAYPLKWVRDRKFWSPVSRINNVYGDRNLVCSCRPIEEYAAQQ